MTVRGYAELYRMGALPEKDDVAQAMERIEKEAIRMTELVQDLLELARLDETKPLQLRRVDLLPLARDAARDTMAAAPDRVVTVVGLDAETLAAGPIAPANPVDVDAEPSFGPTAEVDGLGAGGPDTLTRPIKLPAGSTTTTPGRGAALTTGSIAFAGALRLQAGQHDDASVRVAPRWDMASLPAV